MVTLLKQLNLVNKLPHTVGLLSAIIIVATLTRAVEAKTEASSYEPEQWQVTQALELPVELDVAFTEPAAAPPPGESAESVDVIQNGDFEEPWESMNGVAPKWEPYGNGQAHFGWYEESWPEAVRKGDGHAQLMEIFEVEANILDRVIAIHQTVDVAANADYNLTMYAIMRTDAPEPNRNKFEYEMHWGIDPWGEGNYDNVEEWIHMPLTEQLRIGSNASYPEDIPLFYERITGTVRTGENTNGITLFIRGLKKFPTGTEVNFDIDDVSLVGPSPAIVLPAAQTNTDESASSDSAEDSDALPSTGAALSFEASVGTFMIGGLVLLILATVATARLLGLLQEP